MKTCLDMSHTGKLKKSTTLVQKQYVTGPSKEELTTELSKISRGKHGFTILNQLEDTLNRKKLPAKYVGSCMQGFQVRSKKETSKDRSNFCEKSTQKGTSLQTSVPDLTLKGEDFPSWWSKSVERKSRKLWLPIKTDLPGSAMNCLERSVKKMDAESWFSAESFGWNQRIGIKRPKNSKKTYLASSTSLLQDVTEKGQGNSGKKEPNSLRKIRLVPNKVQKTKLNDVFHRSRYAYNLLVEKSQGILFSSTLKSLRKELRPLVQKKTTPKEFLKKIPEEALDSSFRDLLKARKTTLALSKKQKAEKGKGFTCKLNFKRRKAPSQSIEIRARSIKQVGNSLKFWSRYFNMKKFGMKYKGKIPALGYSCRIQRTRNGKFYLCIPEYKEFPQTKSEKSCAIDPGVRTMLTGYDPEGFSFEFGAKSINKLTFGRCRQVDKLKAKLRKFKGKRNKRYRLHLEILNIQRKVRNMIADCHHKISKWLSVNYSKVLLPKFQTQQMCRKSSKRKIHRSTARNMMTWSHYKFKELLRYKMQRTGGKLIDCTEEYTSKTCTKCGRLNHTLGSSKVFCCPFCNLTIDRDINGARNIFLKNVHLL